MDIVCRKSTCEYNDRLKCTRKHLSVNKNALCSDMDIDQTKNPPNISKDMFEVAPDIAPFCHCKCVDIRCNSKDCLLNSDGVCKANGILVNDIDKKAECCTFTEK